MTKLEKRILFNSCSPLSFALYILKKNNNKNIKDKKKLNNYKSL